MRFLKVHGLGNDFVLVDAREERDLPAEPGELAALARRVCHRNFGVGADGLVLLGDAVDADISMKIINSDGSEAEMCGNAIRCVARYAFERGEVRGDSLRVRTPAGIMVPEIISLEGRVQSVRVDMGEPVLDRVHIPMLGDPGRVVDELLHSGGNTFRVTAVSMGNPHCIIFVEDVEAVPLSLWGPRMEIHAAFPRKTNVEFVQVQSSTEVIMRVWERGAGPTLACGTGACAVAVASALNGCTGREVTVHLAAGSLFIQWKEENNRVYMTGPAEFVFSGDYPEKTSY